MRYYDSIEKKIIYIDREATPELWHHRWQLDKSTYKERISKKNTFIVNTTARYLKPEDGLILEGGSGDGAKVYSLYRAGFKVVGIDFDKQTVDFLNSNIPELDIRYGDVRSVPLEDSSIAGYWSLGVIEHFYEGFDDIANEMKRVIKPGGFLFLTHPYMSPLRKLKARMGLYPVFNEEKKPNGFYQFALDHRLVVNTLKSYGFQLCQFKKNSGLIGFNEEIPLRPLLALESYKGNNKLIKSLRSLSKILFTPFSSHTCLLIFQLNNKSN